MSKTFAIADLHGRFDLLCSAYAAIADRAKTGDKIVHLGDYVDRGRQSRQIIEWLIDDATIPAGMKRVVLKGNHEDMMVRCVRGQAKIGWWIGNGGGATLISYGHPGGSVADPSFVPADHLRWIDALPLIHVDRHRVYVHAFIDPFLPLDGQNAQSMLWDLYPDGHPGGHRKRHVVHGHHQFADGPKVFAGRTDLDTFAWLTGRLVVGVFDDNVPGGAVDLIEVMGKPA